MKVNIEREEKEREEKERGNLIFCEEDGSLLKVMRGEFEIKILILLTIQALHSSLLAGIVQSWGVFQCVSYWFCFNHFIVITARALIFCL